MRRENGDTGEASYWLPKEIKHLRLLLRDVDRYTFTVSFLRNLTLGFAGLFAAILCWERFALAPLESAIPMIRSRQAIWLQVVILAWLSPFAWWLSDREPPWVRLGGRIDPTVAGEQFVVHWRTTPFKRFCPGLVQVEIISGNIIWPVLRRNVSRDTYVGQTQYITDPWPLDSDVPPGMVTYRVSTFWYCNWLQEWINWPIIQVGPFIRFVALPKKPVVPK